MDASLLHPPRNLRALLRRPDLERQFAAGIARQVVLLSAPAGYGKTEAMAAFYRSAEERGHDALWISLPAQVGANTPWAELAGALGSERRPDAVLTALARLSRPFELYLDGLETAAQAAGITPLMEALPEQMRLVIAGRDLPDLRLSRLRMRGLLTELGPGQLAFSRSEVQRLLRAWLSQNEMERLIATLDGWPALVQLALLELERGAKGANRTAILDGSASVYREFLHDEVLSALDPMDWTVLSSVGGLESFTLGIAVDLAGLPGDYPTLRRIERLYPLIEPEEARAGWFRSHPVIEQALAPLVAAEPSEARKARHIRAAELFEHQGILGKSVLHASMAGDVDLAVRMIERAGGVNLFLRAGYTVLRGIIEAVPHDAVLHTPSLRLCRAVMLAKAGHIHEARQVITNLQQDTASGRVPGGPDWEAALGHIHSLTEIYEDADVDAAAIIRLRTEAERQDNTWRLAWLHNHMAIFLTRRGELSEARAAAAQALSLYQEERSTYPQAFMLIHLGFIDLLANAMEGAAHYLGEATTLINARHWNDSNLAAIAHVPVCALQYLQGQVDQARKLLERDMPIMAAGEGWVDFFQVGYATLVRARYAQDGWRAAQEALQDGLEQATARRLPRLRLMLSILRAELQIREAAYDTVEASLRTWPSLASPEAWPTAQEHLEARLVVARLRLRQGEPVTARAMLEALAADVSQRQRLGLLIPANLLLAEACAAMGETDDALVALERAAVMSSHGDQIQQFRDEGPQFAEAIRRLVRICGVSRLRTITPQYLAAAAQPGKAGGAARGAALLSRREAQILALLAENLPNKSIARQLDLAEPTVKFHLKNLYSKLGVGRRSLAVSVARASGLLQ